MVRRDRATLARVLLALALTAAAGLALYWGFLKDDQGVTGQGMRVESGFEKLPNGVPTDRFDTGQPALLSASAPSSGSPFLIRRGKLTYEPSTNDAWVAEISTPDMGQPVSSLGGRFAFAPAIEAQEGGGAVTFVVSRNIQPSTPQAVAPIPVDLVVTAANWTLSLGLNASAPLAMIATGEFDEPLLQDGATSYSVALHLDGGQVTIDLPDGTQRTVKDARISEWSGDFATFGLYSNHGLTDSIGGFQQIWAESTVDR